MNYLMGKGAEFYGREDSNGENILHKLAKSNSPQAIQNFIEQNSKSQRGKNLLLQMSLKKDKNSCTPFFHAVAKGNVEAASLLLSLDETKAVLNEGSDNGYFPLYMAFENRNQNMFFFLLEQPELDAHCSTPIKNDNAYQKIDLSTFYEVRADSYINSKQFPANLFRDAYVNRITWENSGRIGKLIIVDEKIKKQRSEFYKMVCDKNTTIEELKKKRLELGSHISGSDVSENNKNILLQVIDTPRTIESKIELFDFLFSECKISCSGLDMYDSDQILRYTIETAGSNFNRKISDDIEIIKFLIKNHSKYENAYKLTMPRTDYDIWKLILGTARVRNSLEWDELAELLSILDKKADFSKTNRSELFLYSISGGSNANYEELKYKKELFDLFINELNDGKLQMNNIPITTWLYQEKFYYGVEKILCNKKIADGQYIRSARQGTSLDTFKDILENDLTSSDEEIKSHAKKFLDMYNTLYPEEEKAKTSHARAKVTTKQIKNSDSL